MSDHTTVQMPSLSDAIKETTRRYVAANPRSQAKFEEATQYLPGADTRTVNHYDPFPITIVRGKGSNLFDLDGNTYTDFLGDYTAGLYGHSHPTICAAIVEALEGGLAFGGPHSNQHEFAALLCARFPSIERVRFTNSGTEANLMALSLARVATGRTKVLAFEGGYHGGILDFTGPDRRLNASFSWAMGSYNDPAATRELISRHQENLAAVIVEPMLGGGGCIPGTKEFLDTLRQESEKIGAILIFDEVQTSRLGPGGLQQNLGITPDLTTLGKYLGGGASFGAFGGRADLMELFDPRRKDNLHHAGTHNNNVISLSAGLVGFRDVYTPEVAEAHTNRGEQLRTRLNLVAEKRGIPAHLTGLGSIMNVHFQRGRIRRREDLSANRLPTDLFHLEMLLSSFYVARRGFMSLSLAHTEEDCDRLVEAFDAFLEQHEMALESDLV